MMRRVLLLSLLMGCPAGAGGPGGDGLGDGGPGADGSAERDASAPPEDDDAGGDGDAGDDADRDAGETTGDDAGERVDGGVEGPLTPEPEVCDDGRDQDLDERVDEECTCAPGATQACFRGDRRLAGEGACRLGMQLCETTASEFGAWGDCNGDGAPSDEVCSTRFDEDCDGMIDEGCECATGDTRECYPFEGTPGMGVCRRGVEECVDSMWSECEGAVGPGAEVCDDAAADEDCDGAIDEGCNCVLGATRACYPAATGRGVGACRDGMQECVGVGAGSSWGVCDGAIGPASEVCSGGRDEDCDGLIDCADSDCEVACCVPYDQRVPVVPPDAEILFVVDRSGSMQWPALGTTNSRWTELRSAMDSVLPSMSGLDLGLLTFPIQDGTNELLNCGVSLFVDVGIAAGTSGLIQARLATALPRAGDTPTPSAFSTTSAYFAFRPTTARRFVILATDGLPEPNCGATVDATVNAIRGLRTLHGVDTFVLGIVGPDRDGSSAGIPALREGLNRFADAGGRPRAGALRYYEAVDGPSMADAVRAILAAATDCTFELSAAPPPGGGLVVTQEPTAGGAPITVPPGQYTVTGRTLRFTGAACDAVRAGTVSRVRAQDAC